MENYLFYLIFGVFTCFTLYEQTKASSFISKCLTKEARKEQSFIICQKALWLPKPMWINDVTGDYVANLVKANECWQKHIKKTLISFCILFVVIILVLSPSIYYLFTH
jgi:hypothetical protein